MAVIIPLRPTMSKQKEQTGKSSDREPPLQLFCFANQKMSFNLSYTYTFASLSSLFVTDLMFCILYLFQFSLFWEVFP